MDSALDLFHSLDDATDFSLAEVGGEFLAGLELAGIPDEFAGSILGVGKTTGKHRLGTKGLELIAAALQLMAAGSKGGEQARRKALAAEIHAGLALREDPVRTVALQLMS